MLSAKDLTQVFRFVHDLEAKQRMSGRPLSGLTEKLPHATYLCGIPHQGWWLG
jgi:hypothetical protein